MLHVRLQRDGEERQRDPSPVHLRCAQGQGKQHHPSQPEDELEQRDCGRADQRLHRGGDDGQDRPVLVSVERVLTGGGGIPRRRRGQEQLAGARVERAPPGGGERTELVGSRSRREPAFRTLLKAREVGLQVEQLPARVGVLAAQEEAGGAQRILALIQADLAGRGGMAQGLDAGARIEGQRDQRRDPKRPRQRMGKGEPSGWRACDQHQEREDRQQRAPLAAPLPVMVLEEASEEAERDEQCEEHRPGERAPGEPAAGAGRCHNSSCTINQIN